MEIHMLRSAVISTDPGFRDTVRRVIRESGQGIELALEITVPCTNIGEADVHELRTRTPDLVFLDLESDPANGIKLAQFLSEAHPPGQLITTGPALSHDLLLEAMRAGVSEYLQKPVTPDALGTALQRVIRRCNRASGPVPVHAGQLYTVFGAKGGSGCSTLATNLAIVLHRLTGKKTLLLDLDLQLGVTALMLGVEPRFNFLDMVQNFHRMDAGLLASFIERHESGIHFLSAPYMPERTDVVAGDQLRAVLQFMKQHYDYVVVDTATSFSPTALAALDVADQIFVLTHVDLPSLRNLRRCLPLIKRTGGKEPGDRIRLVVNRYRAEDVISLRDVQGAVGLPVYWALSNDYDAVIRSINTGKPIAANGKSRYTRDLQALAADLVGAPHANGWRPLRKFWHLLHGPRRSPARA
jgi:pilus assembly protein CpaE